MKKRFTLMMMVLCFLMSIPLKMMAQTGTNEKLYLIGGVPNKWSEELNRPFETTDGATYKYVLDAAESADYYFRVKTASTEYYPQINDASVGTEFTSADEGKGSNKAWKLTMTKGKSYTLIFDYKNKQIKYSEGGSEVVTKVIKLLNGSDELTGSNGKYTLDLSSATADATITLTIDGKKYGLAAAKTISAAGTSDIAFTTGGTEALTLKAGLLYSITVTDEGKMTVVASVDTTKNNPLPKRTYTQGYYLAGNFFTFSGDKVTYDDAVFKFQQQGNDTEGNAVYMVEIPASLTAHAQVMSVDEFGKPQKVYGPGSAFGISYTCPTTIEAIKTGQLKLAGSDPETFNEGTNYWDIVSRNHSETEYSDGMYKVFITVDKKTGEPTMWEFKHIGNKRVAFFISDAKNATAMPLYDTYKKNDKQFSNAFFGSVNLSAGHSYYVISNYIMNKDYVNKTNELYKEELSSKYDAHYPDGNVVHCPTTNKLFLLGNGGYVFEEANDHNQFSPNEEPMKPSSDNQGSLIIRYNCSNGNGDEAKKHLGIRGQVIISNTRATITSVSMVGDAIPGTFKVDKTTGETVWDYASTAADMTYDETEKCYKVTLVTTAKDGAAKFRFVGNHTKEINWHEDSTTDPKMKAKTPLDGNGEGHEATSYDPNRVNYTEKNENSEADWDIIWNRPAGRWTVRLFFYTRNDGNENAVTDYYYTISANTKLELRDFENVVYKSLDNKRIIHNRGGYKYFRTWSAVKAWKISKDVDIFVVDGMTEGTDGKAKFTLKKVNADPTNTYNVIPSETGVILATKKTAADIVGHAEERERASLTSYNTMVIPMEEYNPNAETTSTDYVGTKYTGTNLLNTLITAQVVPTKEVKEGVTYYNYLFGFYNAKKGLGVTTGYEDNEFLMGFWISKGTGAFYNNSAYLPIAETDVNKMGCLGVSHNDYTSNGAKKVPALFFDFANADGTTGIDEVVNQSTKLNDGKYYTLSGQQVEKPTAGGIYIHNGRKFVVK